MEAFKGRFVRSTPDGVYVTIPFLGAGRSEFGPFPVVGDDLFVDGEEVTLVARNEDVNDLAVVSLPAGLASGGGSVISVAGKTGVVTLVKGDVGLGNVDNTSDVDKPVSTAQQNALNLKADLNSPTFTGTPTAPHPFVGDDSTQVATTGWARDNFIVYQTSPASGELVIGGTSPLTAKGAGGAPSLVASAGGARITNLGTPSASTDATTKAYVDLKADITYVDMLVQGLTPKPVVRVATTGNITLSGTQTIDGVAVVAGNRVLVKDQTTQANNGIYVVAAGSWSRALDADSWTELVSAYVFVAEGTTNKDNGWLCTVDAGGTLGSTAVTWIQFTGAAQIINGAGLSKSGNTLSIANLGVATGMLADGAVTTIKIADANVTAAKLAASAVDLSTSVVTGSLPIAKGGTGATDAYGARWNTGAPGTASSLLPALTAGVWTAVPSINVLLNHNGAGIQFREESSGERVELGWRINGSNDYEVRSDIAVTANTIRAIVVGQGL